MKTKFKNKSLSASSKRWVDRQRNDFYNKKAHEDSVVCRSYYKIEEIQNKYHIIKNDDVILDLGSAPGGWSQFAMKYTQNLFGCDLLNMKISIHNFIQGDFTNKEIQMELQKNSYDVIMSDIAPNTIGNKTVDHLRITTIVEETIDFAMTCLKENGSLVTKMFDGCELRNIIDSNRVNFQKIYTFKPQSSRKNSNEIFLIFLNKKNN